MIVATWPEGGCWRYTVSDHVGGHEWRVTSSAVYPDQDGARRAGWRAWGFMVGGKVW